MRVDFLENLRAEILRNLPHDRADNAVTSALSAMPIRKLLVTFLNWLNRHVHRHPRAVFVSQELAKNQLCVSRDPDFQNLIRKIELGHDLGPHLSKGVEFGYIPNNGSKKDLGRRRDLDLLLNDWGIHHLHLSSVIEPDGFVHRANELLFAIFKERAAFLIDLMPHQSWTDERLVQIAIQSWPGAELFAELRGILGSQSQISKEDRQKLRRAGIMAPVKINNRIFVSRTFGISTAGTSTRSTHQANFILRQFENAAELLEKDPHHFRAEIQRTQLAYPAVPEFRAIVYQSERGYGIGLQEKNSGAVIEFAM